MTRFFDRLWRNVFDDDESSGGGFVLMILVLGFGGAAALLCSALAYLAFSRVESLAGLS
jgi:hypothetical protein